MWPAAFWDPDGTFVGKYRCLARSRGKLRGAFPAAVATWLHATVLSAGTRGRLGLGFRRLRAERRGRRREGRWQPRGAAAAPRSAAGRGRGPAGARRGAGAASVTPEGCWHGPRELTGALGHTPELVTSKGVLGSRSLKELIGVLNHTGVLRLL